MHRSRLRFTPAFTAFVCPNSSVLPFTYETPHVVLLRYNHACPEILQSPGFSQRWRVRGVSEADNYVAPQPTIKNAQFPSCKDCIHFIPDKYNLKYASQSSKCKQFGKKDVVTDKITYQYAYTCRVDESLCGTNGKHFKQDAYIQWKMLGHKTVYLLPYILFISIVSIQISHKYM